MITIKNRIKKVPVDVLALKHDAERILEILRYQNFDLGILLTSNKTIQRYNAAYRHKDKPTDILSFSFHPELKPGQRIVLRSDEDKNLGDLIISPEYVLHDLDRWNQTFEQRMRVLLIHGICHLLGYDHILDEDYKIMHRKELAILKKLQIK